MSKGNNNSIMQDDPDCCYICQKYLGKYSKAVHEHHCMHGTANRKLATKYGLTIFLCYKCHENLHDKHIHDLDIQQDAEKAWLEHYNKTIPDWIKVFGKNYL